MEDEFELPLPLTGEMLATAVKADFEWFFTEEAGFKIEMLAGPKNVPAFVKDSEGVFIAIPFDMAGSVLDDGDTFLFHLLMIGHEVAHLVHKHGDIWDEPQRDTVALEAWADWYGAKVVMTLLYYGPIIMRYRRHFFPQTEIDDLLKGMARAVERLVATVYNDNPRYPAKIERVGLTICGVWSFLRLMKIKDGFDFYTRVTLYLLGTEKVHELVLFADDGVFDPAILARIRKLHKALQGEDAAIALGMKPEAMRFLHTTWDQSDEELMVSQALRRIELEALGHDLLSEK